jgi:hypothetical protein
MAIQGHPIVFAKENVDKSPVEYGVYALYDQGTLIYIGSAADGVTIRSRLQSHLKGNEGVCTEGASVYRREPTNSPVSRKRELVEEYMGSHGGKMPRCNAATP